MKCVFKKIEMIEKNTEGSKITIIKRIDFGDCDKLDCYFYSAYEECKTYENCTRRQENE